MPTREAPADRGRRLARRTVRLLAEELRQARTMAGISQATVAAAAGISRAQVGHLERSELVAPNIEHLASVAAVLGLSLRLNLYPEGEPIGDHVQARLLRAFRARIDPTVPWRTEVPLPITADRRAWDAVAITGEAWIGIEAVSRFGAADAILRQANQKQRDDPRIARVVLVVADTVRNRRALDAGAAAIRAEYPLDTRAILANLRAGRAPPLNGVAILRVPRGPS
jgi:transcriptional regulator with XRE-family HTH domain